MPLSVHELIVDAKRLNTRLKDDESKTDSLLTTAKTTNSQIEAMKMFSDDVEKLNEAACQRPHSVLVAGLQRESQHLRELQEENRALKVELEEYQSALEIIMSKYREQVTKLVDSNQIDLTKEKHTQCSKIIMDQNAKIKRMIEVMRGAAVADEPDVVALEEYIARITTENRGLREMLLISRKHGILSGQTKDCPAIEETSENC